MRDQIDPLFAGQPFFSRAQQDPIERGEHVRLQKVAFHPIGLFLRIKLIGRNTQIKTSNSGFGDNKE